jgi:ribosomal protein L32
MPKSKYTIAEQIAKAKEDIRQHENALKLLNSKQKEQERKARNHRLCSRGGYLESKLPETITLTDEQYYSFLEKTLFTEHSRRILAGLTVPAFTPKAAAETGETTTAIRTE